MRRAAWALLAVALSGCFSTTSRTVDGRLTSTKRAEVIPGSEPQIYLETKTVSRASATVRVVRAPQCLVRTFEQQERKTAVTRRPSVAVYVISGLLATLPFFTNPSTEEPILLGLIAGTTLTGIHLAASGTKEEPAPSAFSEAPQQIAPCQSEPMAGLQVYARTGNAFARSMTNAQGQVTLPIAVNKSTIFFVQGWWTPSPPGLPAAPASALPALPSSSAPAASALPSSSPPASGPRRRPRDGGYRR